MKKLIALNTLIILLHLPYSMYRWMDMPYVDPSFWLEDVMVFGSMLVGSLFFVNTLLLFIFSFVRKGWRRYLLYPHLFLLILMTLYSLYASLMITADGRPVWVDVIAFLVLFVAFRLTGTNMEHSLEANV